MPFEIYKLMKGDSIYVFNTVSLNIKKVHRITDETLDFWEFHTIDSLRGFWKQKIFMGATRIY